MRVAHRGCEGGTAPNWAKSCGASGNEFCLASSVTQYISLEGVDFDAQKANDGVVAYESQFKSGCWGVNEQGGNLCGYEYEWWQLDLSRPRNIKSLTLHTVKPSEFHNNFDIELSNDGITFVKCATLCNLIAQSCTKLHTSFLAGAFLAPSVPIC